MGHDGAVWELHRRQLVRAGCRPELVAGAFAQERNRTAVGGDDLLVLDSLRLERFLHAAARVNPRPALVAVAHIQRGLIGHAPPLVWWRVAYLRGNRQVSATLRS